MINIEKVAKINNHLYFFAKNKKEALSKQDVKNLIDMGCINITEEQFNKIVNM